VETSLRELELPEMWVPARNQLYRRVQEERSERSMMAASDDSANGSRAPAKPSYKAERFLTGDDDYGAPIYGKGEGSDAFKAKLGESVLFPKRLGHADELASMVMELLTNDYMNGEVVRADGGVRLPPK
jgi:hypothetical protein